MRHAAGVTLWALLLIGPALGLAATMLLRGAPGYGPASLTLLAIVVTWSAYALYMLRRAVVAPLRTTSALLQGLREGNFSVRARADIADDDVGVLLNEFNALAAWLQTQRLTEVEASALLTTVMSELESAVLAFDDRHVLRLANPAAARLFARPVESVLGMTAEELGCEPLLQSTRAGSGVAGHARRVGALGRPAFVLQAGWPRASPAGAQRGESRLARGGTARVAAVDPRPQSRAQQLADADHVDRQQPGPVRGTSGDGRRDRAPTCGAALASSSHGPSP